MWRRTLRAASDMERSGVGAQDLGPHVDLVDSATVGLDDRQVLVERRSNGALLDLGVKDDHEFVLTQAHTHLLWSSRPRSIRGRRVCASLCGVEPSMTTVRSKHSNLQGYPAGGHRRNRLWTDGHPEVPARSGGPLLAVDQGV